MSWPDWENKVHFDRGGKPRCGQDRARELAGERRLVSCKACLSLLAGTHNLQGPTPGGYRWADVKPHGTAAAYQRHRRRDGVPVRCETCLQGERRRAEDRRAALRRAA